MMKYPRIAAQLYDQPWLMLQSRFQEMTAAFEKVRTNPAAMEEDGAAADDPVGPVFRTWGGEKGFYHPQIEITEGVALARVHGTTGRGLSKMAMECGGFDTGLFRQQLRNVADDPAVKALVIDFNSPGGMAAGNEQVAADIRGVADSGKRVIGYASMMMCSAAYWMASACDELHADPSAIIGSISTIYAGVDSSRQWANEGLELKLFATGKYKATGMPGKPWSAEEEAMIWDRIRKIDGEFKGYVSERRGVAAEAMEGQWWYAKHAPSGLVDSVSFTSLAEVIEAAFSL